VSLAIVYGYLDVWLFFTSRYVGMRILRYRERAGREHTGQECLGNNHESKTMNEHREASSFCLDSGRNRCRDCFTGTGEPGCCCSISISIPVTLVNVSSSSFLGVRQITSISPRQQLVARKAFNVSPREPRAVVPRPQETGRQERRFGCGETGVGLPAYDSHRGCG
jgi:hypothetical protein